LALAKGNEAQPFFELREAALHCRHIYVTVKKGLLKFFSRPLYL